MRIRCVVLCVCLGWPLATWGADLKAAGDVTNITEYLEKKFQVQAPPGSNDLAAADGRIFCNAQVWKVEPDGLTLRHAEGLDKVEFPLLPEACRQQYGYDPEAAATYQRSIAAAVAAAERSQRILREQIRPSPP